MGSAEKFCLRWNDFETNVSVAFRELREEKDFFDVTLACDDSQIQAHKVILSACSPFFKRVLRRNQHQHPLLYLKGVKYQELLSVLDFMYMGEVNVAQEELNTFLTVAEDLQVKGLTQDNSKQPTTRVRPTPERELETPASQRRVYPPQPAAPPTQPFPPARPAPRPRPPPAGYEVEEDEEVREVVPVKKEPVEGGAGGRLVDSGTTLVLDTAEYALEEEGVEYDYSEYGEYEDGGYDQGPVHNQAEVANEMVAAREAEIVSHIVKDETRKMFTCNICQFGASSRHKAFCHIESKHFQDSPVNYPCQFCNKSLNSRNALGIHVSRHHKEERGSVKNSIFPKDSYNSYF